MSLERLFLDHLPVIDQVVQFVGRRHHLGREAIAELQSAVHLKIIDNDYEVLRKFEGRSSLRTYLTAIVQRHFLDSRSALWGRWRPSAMARRAGPAGILLDQLLTRDNLDVSEAVAKVSARFQADEAALRELAAELPARTPRRFIGEEHLLGVAAEGAAAQVDASLIEDEARRTEAALSAALATLPAEDRVILTYRFVHGLQISQIARLTALEQKPLYRRLEKIIEVLRPELEARGVGADHVTALLLRHGAEPGRVAWTGEKRFPEGRPTDE